MKNQDKDELLPCPFCGDKTQLRATEYDDWKPFNGYIFCACGIHLSRIPFLTDDEMIKHWNTRTPNLSKED